MGLFDIFKKKKAHEEYASAADTISGVHTASAATVPEFNGMPLLDLKKGDILDLNKCGTLQKIRASAGWKIKKKKSRSMEYDYDLDLCAYLVNKDKEIVDTVYYGAKKASGIELDKDDLTGNSGGDAENIFVNLDKIKPHVEEVYFAVVIYEAKTRRQYFGEVQDAYVRLVDEGNGDREICRYRMTEDGGLNTAVVAAKLKRNGSSWSFEAIGKYYTASISSLGLDVRNL